MKLNEKIKKAMIRNSSCICCGLDPDIKKMPAEIKNLNVSEEEKILIFLREIIDIVSPYVCAFKIQKAFFDVLSDSKDVLRKTIKYIHSNYENLIVIMDCKIGDIDNTMKIYLKNIFDDLDSDGIVVNPYMGDDVFSETKKYENKLFFVLCDTSNRGSKIIQNLRLKNEKLLWEQVLDLTINRWNPFKNMIPILSCGKKIDFSKIKSHKDQIFFIAGFGTQGGDNKNILNCRKYSFMVNSSRAILYPYKSSDKNWKEKVLDSVIKHRQKFKW